VLPNFFCFKLWFRESDVGPQYSRKTHGRGPNSRDSADGRPGMQLHIVVVVYMCNIHLTNLNFFETRSLEHA
jgi:hypothetical protein